MAQIVYYTNWTDATHDKAVSSPNESPVHRRTLAVTRSAGTKKAVRFSTAVLMQQAIAEGDVQELSRFLDEYGVSILNETDPSGLTPVMRAVLESQLSSLVFLVEAGADLSARGHDGWTPLHVAAAANNTKAARYVIRHERERRPDASRKFERRETHRSGRESGYDVLVNGRGPQRGATQRSERRDVTELARKNCSTGGDGALLNSILSTKTAYDSLLHLGAEKNYILLVRYLLENALVDPDMRDRDGRTPLHVAASQNSTEAFLLLVMHGASLNLPDRYGRRACELTEHQTIRKIERLSLESREEML
eukprot:Em0917g2a